LMNFQINLIINKIMGKLVDFLVTILMVCLLVCLIKGIKVHTLDETHMNKTFSIKDIVYVFPDTITECVVESGYIFTAREKDKITNVKKDVTFSEYYTMIYNDKNGVKQYLKNVNSKLLIKK
jgi:hypothetical protein